MTLHRARPGAIAAALLLVVCMAATQYVAAQGGHGSSPGTSRKQPLVGRVIDETGRPVEGATVSSELYDSDGAYAGTVTGTTNKEGEFATTELAPGLYVLWVQAPPLIVVGGIPDRGASPGVPVTIRMARGAAISGKVVDRDGQPLTGLLVEPVRVRDEQGTRFTGDFSGYSAGWTDDRGVYRIWGLKPGTYVVAAGHSASFDEEPRFLSDRTRTYHPSANRAGATEVTVRTGDDLGNVDIAFRGDKGSRLSGVIVSAPSVRGSPNAWVRVFRAGSMATEAEATANVKGDALVFRFESVEDGDYELVAQSWDDGVQVTSDRVPVRIRGADISGIRIELLPSSTLAGRIEVQPAKSDDACNSTAEGKAPPPLHPGEFKIRVRRVDASFFPSWTVRPTPDGEFKVKGMGGPRYRLSLEFADDDAWVVTLDRPGGAGVTSPVTGAKGIAGASGGSKVAGSRPVASDGVRVERGKHVDGVRFVVARGAARVRGRIVPANAGEPLPSRARVCLVPADAKQKDDVIHYYEVLVERDGTFDVRNVAPGEYFVATRTFPGDDRPDLEIFPAAWDAAERVKLRLAAEKAGIRITLSPCQRLESAVITMKQS